MCEKAKDGTTLFIKECLVMEYHQCLLNSFLLLTRRTKEAQKPNSITMELFLEAKKSDEHNRSDSDLLTDVHYAMWMHDFAEARGCLTEAMYDFLRSIHRQYIEIAKEVLDYG